MDEIKVLLEKIIRLQREAVRGELQEEMCDADFLGVVDNVDLRYNTRPVQVFTNNDRAWRTPIGRNNDFCDGCEETCIFRAERIEGDSAVFRALEPCERGCMHEEPCDECHEHTPLRRRYKSTDSFITIRLDRISALRCLKDTFVDICIR